MIMKVSVMVFTDYTTPFSRSGKSHRLHPFFVPSLLPHIVGALSSADTACSSSLVTTHLAAAALQNGTCSVAAALGVNLCLVGTAPFQRPCSRHQHCFRPKNRRHCDMVHLAVHHVFATIQLCPFSLFTGHIRAKIRCTV